MLERLFGSRTRMKLLRLFFTHPEEQYFVRELSRHTNEQINSVRRELSNLERIGIVESERREKKKYFRTRKDFVLFTELRTLILKSRLTLEKEFIQSIRSSGSIHYLVLTGYFVNDPDAQVDLFIVGSVNRGRLNDLLAKFQSRFGAALRFTVMSREEYRYRKDITDKFLYRILNGKKVVVIDKFGQSATS